MKNMKKSSHIISILKRKSEFSALAVYDEITLFKAAYLTPHLKNALDFIYYKDEILFFVAKHPAFCQEFNYTAKGIINALQSYPDKFPTLSKLKDAKAFVSRKYKKPLPSFCQDFAPKKPAQATFKEHAQGDFVNHCKDSKLSAIFERIREFIKNAN